MSSRIKKINDDNCDDDLNSAKSNTENHWFTTVVLLSSGLGSIYYFVNAWRWILVKEELLLRQGGSFNDNLDEDTMYFIDIIFGTVLLAVFVWCVLRLYFSRYPYEFEGYK